VIVSTCSLLLRGISAAIRQGIHLSDCSDLPSYHYLWLFLSMIIIDKLLYLGRIRADYELPIGQASL
jgi:hypothetical protein